MNGETGNRIDFNIHGLNPPQTGTRSTGTKIVLWPGIGTADSNVDYAFGLDTMTLWSSVPNSNAFFRWYAGNNNITTLSRTGALSTASVSTTGNVSVGGNLTVTGQISYKPYAAVLITSNISTGAITVTSMGSQTITASNVTRVGGSGGGVYNIANPGYLISFPTPHPNGTAFCVMATPYTGSTSSWDASYPGFTCTTKAEGGGVGMSVWCRQGANFVHGSFYVYTVP